MPTMEFRDDQSISSTESLLKFARHDTPMQDDRTTDELIDVDMLPEPSFAPMRSHLGRETDEDYDMVADEDEWPEAESQSSDLDHYTDENDSVVEHESEQEPLLHQFRDQLLRRLPAPIPKLLPENRTKAENSSEKAKARIFEYIKSIDAPFKTATRYTRRPNFRKDQIEAALPQFFANVAALNAEDQVSCIEQINSQVICGHNTSDRTKQFQVQPVPYPAHAVDMLRQTFALKSNLPYQLAESLMAWPIEFNCRLPFLPMLQLEDIADRYPEVRADWDEGRDLLFKNMWRKLCADHNAGLAPDDEDYVDPDIIYTNEERAANLLLQSMDPVEPIETPEREEALFPTPEVDDRMDVDEPGVDSQYHSPDVVKNKDCIYCNNDPQYRPRCPDLGGYCCEYCSQPCSCGAYPP